MIAVIVAATRSPAMHGIDEHLPISLFPLGDRPLLHHVIDTLAAQGVRCFEFLLGHLPEKVEAYLVDGARWGCSFNFHLMPAGANPIRVAESIVSGLEEEVVFGRGDRLPAFELSTCTGPTVFATASREWTGWAVLPSSSRYFMELSRYDSDGTRPASFREVEIQREVDFTRPANLLHSQHDVMTGAPSESPIAMRQTRPGIWIARSVSLHRTVQLHAPVLIGPNCKIQQGATIGPSAVLGEGCIVDEHSSVKNALVAPGTYIGQHLELEDVIVDRNRVLNAKLDTAFLVSESFLLSGLERRRRVRLSQRVLSVVGAFALMVLTAPVAMTTLFILWMGRKGAFCVENAVRIPAVDDPRAWQIIKYLHFRLHDRAEAGWWIDFACEVWLGLFSVLGGNLHLVGVKPRSPRELERLPRDWKAIYLSTKAGLITEAVVMFGKSPNADELYTAEAYYSATAGLRHDLRLLWCYLRRLLSYSEQIRLDFTEEPSFEFHSGEGR